MPRPIKCRRITGAPAAVYFKPACIPMRELIETVLTLDEFEALRLSDYKGLYHEIAAKHMGVSRQTFGNILSSARHKIADTLLNGKILRIEGGNIEPGSETLVCGKCRHKWDKPPQLNAKSTCPECGSGEIDKE